MTPREAVDPAPDEPTTGAGRRAYDRNIDPMVEVVIDQRIADSRHFLRSEFTAALISLTNKITELAGTVAAGNLQSTREHAENKACIEELRRDIAELKPLGARVTALERHDDVDTARDEEREKLQATLEDQSRWMAGTRRWMIGIGLTISALLIAVLEHLH